MNRNSIFIGLFLAVFVFPTNNSLVFAKSCKDQKNDLRAEKKAEIQSVCEGEILPLLGQLTNHSRNREVNQHTNAGFCRGGDWSVSTNPKGNCRAQKGHIRKKYNDKIESLKAFVVDTQNVVEAQEIWAEALRPKMLKAGIVAAYEVAKEMNRNGFKWDSWKKLDIRGREPVSWAPTSALRVTVKLQEISASSESELLEAAVKEIVNRMNQEQLEAIEHKLCITAHSRSYSNGYIKCEEFKKGYKR